MRVFVTGGAGFIGRAFVRLLLARGDAVTCAVRDPDRVAALGGEGARLVAGDLSDAASLASDMAGHDAVVHIAGMYRIGIRPDERPAMWDANVGATERVLDAAIATGIARIVHISTANVYGNTNGLIVDESFERDLSRGWLSYYDETKYRAHEAAETRIATGAPIVIALPGGVYGRGDHFEAGRQLERAYQGRLQYFAFGRSGLAWTHVDDVAEGLLRLVDRGRLGQAYNLAGEPLLLRDAIAAAARVGGHRPPRIEVPTGLLRALVPLGPAVAAAMGLPANLAEVISASEGVTYWVSSARASAELGFTARDFAVGVRDAFGPSDR